DVAVAMGGGAYRMAMPKVCRVVLTGALPAMVSAKDVILEILRRLSVKGGVGKVMEYSGDGLSTLTVPERATIANMGAELGATTSVFPSDDVTRQFLQAQGRGGDWTALEADPDALYDEELTVDLSALLPLVALPDSPDAVVPVATRAGLPVDQVCIGSCTNSSFADMMKVAAILEGSTVNERVSLTISPGSRQVLTMLAANGALAAMVAAGARILESGCGPCIGMGQAPATGAVSLRTFNRNFHGRSGTVSAGIYLVSPETAAVSAISGVLTDPRGFGAIPQIPTPDWFPPKDNMVVQPDKDGATEVVRGPNIKPFPKGKPVAGDVRGPLLIKLGDNITTDDIMPSTAKLLPYRSNIPYLADFCLVPCDPGFPARAKGAGGGVIAAGANYGQGSSREHAALAPLYLGVRAVVAVSFARIHRANLINNGILPLTFVNPADLDALTVGDELVIEDAAAQLDKRTVTLQNKTTGKSFVTAAGFTEFEAEMLKAGGLINLIGGGKNA
ncbi:MAG TPA: aconitate hydratase, partial [Candidatus Acidoferrum sp.]|nr:aconitate hydratase [Candidatus Acidoferrum sp.]